MLNRDQTIAFLMANQRRYENGPLGERLPLDVVQHIFNASAYNSETDEEFSQALLYFADGKLKELEGLLEKNPRLVLPAGTVYTRRGATIVRKTLYEGALGEGDFEMAAMIGNYYSKFPGGEDLRKKQFERYRPHIEAMKTQEPDASLKRLIACIIESNLEDVREELKTGKNYNWDYKSEHRYGEDQLTLREALDGYRAEKLSPEQRYISHVCMHYNPQNLIYVYGMLDLDGQDYRKLLGKDANDQSLGKLYLVAQQIAGLIHLLDLPAYEKYVFTRDQIELAMHGYAIDRSTFVFEYRNKGATFPDFNIDNFNSHVGVGFDSFVSLCGGVVGIADGRGDVFQGLRKGVGFFTNLMSSKNIKLAELMQEQPPCQQKGAELMQHQPPRQRKGCCVMF